MSDWTVHVKAPFTRVVSTLPKIKQIWFRRDATRSMWTFTIFRGRPHIITLGRGGSLTICYIRYMGMGGYISYCYITQPDFSTVIRPAGLFTNTVRIRTDCWLMLIEMFVDLLQVFIAWTRRETVLMADDSCYYVMLCFTNYIEFLSHDVGGGGGWPIVI